MLVRARVKREEYLPEWAKCCEASRKFYSAMDVEYVDLERQQDGGEGCCVACESPIPETRDIWAIRSNGKGGWSVIGVLDLDEGPLEAR